MNINGETEKDILETLKECQGLTERIGVLNVIAERRLLNYLTTCEYAQRIEMQCAGMVAIVSAETKDKL